MSEFDRLWERCAQTFRQQRVAERARRIILSQLACLGRHTLTGVLCACGRQFQDWSADYRLFERERIDEEALFSLIQREIESHLSESEPLVTALDDSILRKKGRAVHGAGWRRDPLGPPFHVNFVFGQRILQISAALPCDADQARMVPVDFKHVPPATKPRANASASEKQRYKQQAKQTQLNAYAVERLARLRQRTPAQRPLWILVDGRFTNRTVCRDLPPDTTLIGRIRKDARLHECPKEPAHGKGRPRIYGRRLPTPEELRKDDSIPWQKVRVFACGKYQNGRVKTFAPVRWHSAGARDLRLVVIAPLRYRKSLNAPLNYRKPAYLICTDPDIPIEKVLQSYIWRWDIEVNFRDEKTILGVGQAQVRTAAAAQKAPATAVVAYSLLLLAAARAFGPNARPGHLPPPKWQTQKPKGRASTGELLAQLRFELWGTAIDPMGFSGFSNRVGRDQKPQKIPSPIESAVFYATA